MKTVFISSLSVGDKFRFPFGECIWTLVELDPIQYSVSVRASSGRVTAPFNKYLEVIEL